MDLFSQVFQPEKIERLSAFHPQALNPSNPSNPSNTTNTPNFTNFNFDYALDHNLPPYDPYQPSNLTAAIISPTMRKIRLMSMIFIFITGTTGNLLFIGALIFEKKLRSINNGWMFFVNLAITDMLVTTVAVPLLILNDFSDFKFFNTNLCLLTAALSGISCHGAAANLTAIALTRYSGKFEKGKGDFLNFCQKKNKYE